MGGRESGRGGGGKGGGGVKSVTREALSDQRIDKMSNWWGSSRTWADIWLSKSKIQRERRPLA